MVACGRGTAGAAAMGARVRVLGVLGVKGWWMVGMAVVVRVRVVVEVRVEDGSWRWWCFQSRAASGCRCGADSRGSGAEDGGGEEQGIDPSHP